MEVVEAGVEETSGEEDEEEDEEAVEETSEAVGEGVGEGGTSGGEEGAAGEVVAGALAEHKRMLDFATFRASTSEHFREFVLCASKPKSCSLSRCCGATHGIFMWIWRSEHV